MQSLGSLLPPLENLRALLDWMPDGVAQLTRAGEMLFMNRSLQTILGCSWQPGLRFSQLPLPARARSQWSGLLGYVLSTGQSGEMESEWNDCCYSVRLLPERAEQGQLICLVRDITAQNRAEQERHLRLLRAERLDQAGQALAKAGADEKAALEQVAHLAAEFLGETCFVNLLSSDGLQLEPAACWDCDDLNRRSKGYRRQRRPFEARSGFFQPAMNGQSQRLPYIPGFLLGYVLPDPSPEDSVGGLLIAPMRTGQAVLGLLMMISSRCYSDEDEALLQELADRTALSLVNARQAQELERRVEERTRELAEANRQLEALASCDALTGLANRRRFDTTLEAELQRARREHDLMSLLLADIDYFKKFNDRYGHVAGDECLCQLASILQSCFRRSTDLVARYGGEEFAVILPGLTAEQALHKAEELRLAVLAARLPEALEGSGSLTISVGICTTRVEGCPDAKELIETADRALYQSKTAGRNRCTSLGGNP
jgi:diguanylate cyclase (GGDEF)-like protein